MNFSKNKRMRLRSHRCYHCNNKNRLIIDSNSIYILRVCVHKMDAFCNVPQFSQIAPQHWTIHRSVRRQWRQSVTHTRKNTVSKNPVPIPNTRMSELYLYYCYYYTCAYSMPVTVNGVYAPWFKSLALASASASVFLENRSRIIFGGCKCNREQYLDVNKFTEMNK